MTDPDRKPRMRLLNKLKELCIDGEADAITYPYADGDWQGLLHLKAAGFIQLKNHDRVHQRVTVHFL